MKLFLITLFLFSCTLAQHNKEFASGNNLFTASVFKELSKKGEGNILVSPLSAEIILALTNSGARDETAEEIRNSLHLPVSEDKIKSSLKELFTNLNNSQYYKLYTANKIYVKENFSVKKEFKQVAQEIYQADIENINFGNKNEAAGIINKWVEEQTENKIHDLVDSSNLDANIAAILVNTLYFRGRWINIFEKTLTKKDKFYRTANDVVEVDTMHTSSKLFGYYENQELKAKFLDMFFEGDKLSMVIVLPDEKDGLTALENNLDQVFTPRRVPYQLVNLALPKFKIQSKTDFKEILNNLGVQKAFSRSEADLSGIAGNKGDLYIDKIIQKAFIDVNEEGVEATAATEVEIGLGASIALPKTFTVDHPFIYYIKLGNVILFAGKVTDPTY